MTPAVLQKQSTERGHGPGANEARWQAGRHGSPYAAAHGEVLGQGRRILETIRAGRRRQGRHRGRGMFERKHQDTQKQATRAQHAKLKPYKHLKRNVQKKAA
eukprot:jgi/Astpho2/7582/Aster-02488